ncbi:hypothetical protein L1D14_03875 [Vibrio tubiashii]|uniref:hypothetical protein n=1 Tax=Vibrio tubiashii TaxID=29498 RepID=UPI001EFD0FF9|nr:hypothetical protein [Vibrio tubiashii]MCG9575369.1 hypothetical protein [Vibrio tubiashii]
MSGFLEKVEKMSAVVLVIIVIMMLLSWFFGNDLKDVIALAVTDLQQLHVDLYWLSIKQWLENVSSWTVTSYVVIAAICIYTTAKAIVIVKHYDVDDGQYGKRLAALISGCGLAALAPYRMTQASERLKDQKASEDMAAIRIKTISSLKVNSGSINRIGMALSNEPHALSCFTDLSSTYIVSAMNKADLSPNE